MILEHSTAQSMKLGYRNELYTIIPNVGVQSCMTVNDGISQFVEGRIQMRSYSLMLLLTFHFLELNVTRLAKLNLF